LQSAFYFLAGSRDRHAHLQKAHNRSLRAFITPRQLPTGFAGSAWES
jgi:hypothetical protein